MKRSAATIRALRDRFLAQIAPASAFQGLFDHLPGVSFFVKDRASVLMLGNRQFYERFGFSSAEALIGKSDYDLAPPGMADHFRKDDAEVMETKTAKLNIIELFTTPAGTFDWYLTHKMPLLDRAGNAMGIMGTSQPYEHVSRISAPAIAIDRAVAHIREHYHQRITVDELARHVSISPRHLQRRFVEALGVGPQLFLIKVRIQAACDLLQRSTASLAEIAERTGFVDQSAFTQHFRRHLGVTPHDYRKRHRIAQRTE
jgi:AraC-like DNA-binding protein